MNDAEVAASIAQAREWSEQELMAYANADNSNNKEGEKMTHYQIASYFRIYPHTALGVARGAGIIGKDGMISLKEFKRVCNIAH